MAASLDETLISAWRQALVEETKVVTVDGASFPVRRTSRSRLREVDFKFEDTELRGLEQNPKTSSRWAKLAREGKKVMQFLCSGADMWPSSWMEKCSCTGKRLHLMNKANDARTRE